MSPNAQKRGHEAPFSTENVDPSPCRTLAVIAVLIAWTFQHGVLDKASIGTNLVI